MAGHDRLEHDRFGEFLGFRFDHQHGVARSGDDEVERRIPSTRRCVGLTFSAPLMKPTRAAPTGPMNGMPDKVSAAEARDHRHNVGIIFEIVREHRRDDLRVVAIAVGKQRADRAVDQA